MSGYPHSYSEGEDVFGLRRRDLHDGRNDLPSSFPDVPVGYDTPLHSYGGTPSSRLGESHNGQFPVHHSDFGQPSPKFYDSTPEYFPKTKEDSRGRTNREARHWQQQANGYRRDLEQCRSENKGLSLRSFQCVKDRSIRLFQCLKDLNRYDEAEELYHEICKEYEVGAELQDVTERGREHGTNDYSKILGLKHTFAEMLIEQQRFAEAELISRSVWEKRKHCPGTPLEDFQKSHRQLCSVLRALGEFKDAERMHNDMYQREPKDEWALENGDEVCQTLKEQKEVCQTLEEQKELSRKAKDLQEKVWKTRLEKHSPRELTIQSGLRLIGFLELLEELNKPVEYESGTEAEKGFASSTRQVLKYELEMTLGKIWRTRLQPEPNINMLDVGHKLGVRLLQKRKFLEAEGIFQFVWESKKQNLGEENDSTLSSGSMLYSTMCRQGKQEHYPEAVKILGLWFAKQIGTESCDAEAISSIKDLAQAYCSLGNLEGGECVYDWICSQMQQGGSKYIKARWDLGVTLHKQGKDKSQKAIPVLKEVYERWNKDDPNSDETLKCGQMLAQSLSAHDAKSDEALKVAQDVFEKRRVSETRGVAYLESAQLYGSLLLNVRTHEEARSVLQSAWKCQPGNPEEQKLRLKCGPLYGQALAGIHKYPAAKRILHAVAEDQRGIERTETLRLLEEVVLQEKEWKNRRTKARPKGRSVIYLKQ